MLHEHMKIQPLPENKMYKYNVYDKYWNLISVYWSGYKHCMLHHYGDYYWRGDAYIKLMGIE